jgi:hypothetical protein
MAQAMRAILLASAIAAIFVGRRANNAVSQWPTLGAINFGITDHRQSAGREQAAQIAVPVLADTAELFLAPTRVLLRHEPDPRREIRDDWNAFGSATLATGAVASTGPTPGIGIDGRHMPERAGSSQDGSTLFDQASIRGAFSGKGDHKK